MKLFTKESTIQRRLAITLVKKMLEEFKKGLKYVVYLKCLCRAKDLFECMLNVEVKIDTSLNNPSNTFKVVLKCIVPL